MHHLMSTCRHNLRSNEEFHNVLAAFAFPLFFFLVFVVAAHISILVSVGHILFGSLLGAYSQESVDKEWSICANMHSSPALLDFTILHRHMMEPFLKCKLQLFGMPLVSIH